MRCILQIIVFAVTSILFNGVAWANYSSDDFLNELNSLISNAGGKLIVEKAPYTDSREIISPVQIYFEIENFFETGIAIDVNINYDWLIIEQVSENKIEIEFSPFLSIAIDSNGLLNDSFELLVELKQTPANVLLERDEDVRKFFTSNSILTQEISRVVLNGSEIPIKFRIKLKDYLYKLRINNGSDQNVTIYDLKSEIQDLSVFSEVIDSENGFGTQITRVNNEDIKSTFNLNLPYLSSMFDFVDEGINPLDKGLSFGFFYERSAGLSESIVLSQDFNVLTRIEDEGVQGGFGISKYGINFLFRILGLRSSLQNNEFSEAPIKASVDDVAFEMNFPFLNEKNGSDFKLYMNIDDLLLSENIWSFMGIGNNFSRNPIDLRLDISGDLNWLLNLMDLTELENLSRNNPMKINNLNINDFRVSLGKTEIIGSGSFVFVNKEFQALSGIGLPHPVGQLRVELRGVYDFVDKLMSKRIIDKQTGIFILGLIAVYTTPSNEDDYLLSVIEIKESGEILINNKAIQ